LGNEVGDSSSWGTKLGIHPVGDSFVLENLLGDLFQLGNEVGDSFQLGIHLCWRIYLGIYSSGERSWGFIPIGDSFVLENVLEDSSLSSWGFIIHSNWGIKLGIRGFITV
jgi:hypothetical protein